MGLRLLNHPAADDAVSILRNQETGTAEFRAASDRVALLLAVEALRQAETAPFRVRTPLEEAEARRLAGPITAAPILRAGLALVSGFRALVPNLVVGSIGLARNEETAEAEAYYCRLPDLSSSSVWILDPMLATGGSAVRAISACREAGAERLGLACVVAAPEGVDRVMAAEPDIEILAACLDRGLDVRSYILPGLGDYGDRWFGV
jgi:uracil phosphoribosyltransferase